MKRGGSPLGILLDVVVGDGSLLTELVVDTGRGTRRIPVRNASFGEGSSPERAA